MERKQNENENENDRTESNFKIPITTIERLCPSVEWCECGEIISDGDSLCSDCGYEDNEQFLLFCMRKENQESNKNIDELLKDYEKEQKEHEREVMRESQKRARKRERD